MVVGDGGQASTQGALADRPGEAGDVGGDQHGVGWQSIGIGPLLPAPGGEDVPVPDVGGARGGRDRVRGVVRGSSDGLPELALQQATKLVRQRM